MSRGSTSSSSDFFVSYTNEDRAWAEWIAWLLEEDGHTVLVQAWDFTPGANWVHTMRSGVTRATYTLVVLSDSYLNSTYASIEWQAAWAADAAGRARKLLVARVADCGRPGFLGSVVGVDLFGTSESKAKARLRTLVQQALSGRAKPESAPDFPDPVSIRAIQQEPRYPDALPQIWNMPARVSNFTGRVDELTNLTQALSQKVAIFTVIGSGGVGKTALVNEYAYQQAARYDTVWWINAEEPVLIAAQFMALAEMLGLEPGLPTERLAYRVYRALRETLGWLLVFDNVSSISDLRGWLPFSDIPDGNDGHIAITARYDNGFNTVGSVLRLDTMTSVEAVALMKAWVPSLNDVLALEIVTDLDRLPLALVVAARQLEHSGVPADRFRRVLQTWSNTKDTEYKRADIDSPTTSIWDFALNTLTRESLAATQLMKVCAYFAPEPIPLDLFASNISLLPLPLAEVASDPIGLSEAVGKAADLALAKRTPGGLQPHPVAQDAIRRLRPVALADQPIGEHDGTYWFSLALLLLRSDLPPLFESSNASNARWKTLLPHVLVTTNEAMRELQALSRRAIEACCWLLMRGAEYLRANGNRSEPRILLAQALEVAQIVDGSVSPRIVAILTSLSESCHDVGLLDEAEAHAAEAFDISEAVYGSSHSAVATLLTRLAAVRRDRGQAKAALPLLERALAIETDIYGTGDEALIATRSDLAEVLQEIGEPAAAQPLLEMALATVERTHGPDHPAVATQLNKLATCVVRSWASRSGATTSRASHGNL